MKKILTTCFLPLILLSIYGTTYAEQSKDKLLLAKGAVIHCVKETYPLIKHVDPSNPCKSGSDCFYAWQLEQNCGAILTKNFPNCFFAVSNVTQVKCLEKGQTVSRDKENWDPNLKFHSKYTLIDDNDL